MITARATMTGRASFPSPIPSVVNISSMRYRRAARTSLSGIAVPDERSRYDDSTSEIRPLWLSTTISTAKLTATPTHMSAQ